MLPQSNKDIEHLEIKTLFILQSILIIIKLKFKVNSILTEILCANGTCPIF
jgi:hypothetical protein